MFEKLKSLTNEPIRHVWCYIRINFIPSYHWWRLSPSSMRYLCVWLYMRYIKNIY